MFHQDELVHNYLAQASQRYAEQRVQRHLQSEELEQVLSPKSRTSESRVSSATRMVQVCHSHPAFERKNTLLLTGKSKFYTMSYEEHCRTPSPPPAVNQPSSATEQYPRTAADNLSARTLADSVTMAEGSGSENSPRSGSLGENLPARMSSTTAEYKTLSLCVAEPFAGNSHRWPYKDRNHNSIFSANKAQCQGADSCPHAVAPQAGNICAACSQAKRYSLVVRYPTAATKL